MVHMTNERFAQFQEWYRSEQVWSSHEMELFVALRAERAEVAVLKDCLERAKQLNLEYNTARETAEAEVAELKFQEKELTESRDFWKNKYYEVAAIAQQINTDWIPANQKLSARAAAAEAKLRAVGELSRYQAEILGSFTLRPVVLADELEALLNEKQDA